MNNGQSVTFNVKSYDACYNQLDSKNYTFSRGSYYFRPEAQPEIAQELNVFPNPSDGRLNLVFPEGFEGGYLVRDLQGREIHKSGIISGSGPFEADLQKLRSGVYFIQAVDEVTGKAYSAKFLIK